MQVSVALYGSARVVTGKSRVDIDLDEPSGTVTLGQVLEALCASHPRARPYLLAESGTLQNHIRVLINDVRPEPDAALATLILDGDRVTLLVAVAGGYLPP